MTPNVIFDGFCTLKDLAMIKHPKSGLGRITSFCTLKDLAMIKQRVTRFIKRRGFCTLKDLAMIKLANCY